MTSLSHILSELNEVQKEIVTSEGDNILVVAGAGSGKTRVMTSRITWLVQECQVSPYSILAVTFTNKAAREMRERVASMLGGNMRGLWIGTFHSIASRLLRIHFVEAGLSQNYQILDSDDQLRLIKLIMRDKEYDETQYPPKTVRYYINKFKDECQRPNNVPIDDYPNKQLINTVLSIYRDYEEACARAEVVDFAELLFRAYELWQHEEILERYRQRFSHVLVDEFQDTNTLQYRWVRMLSRPKQCAMVVGDDDQSIYGWRGARVDNMQSFQKDFSAKLFRLEQNYRSTSNILNAANALIGHNSSRLGKELWTDQTDGEPLTLYPALNEYNEADFVVQRLQEWHKAERQYENAAVLYRSHAQSRVLEHALSKATIPFRIYGGLRFYERAEIKNILAYFRIIVNRNDDVAFIRALTSPARGVGLGSVEKIRNDANQQATPLWQSAARLLSMGTFSTKISNGLSEFMKLIERLSTLAVDLTLAELAEAVLEQSGLRASYQKGRDELAQARIENLQEFVVACDERIKNQDDLSELEGEETSSNRSSLEEFVTNVALEADQETTEGAKDQVQLMTMHAVKGLEFPLVFIVGMEEGLLPHSNSIKDGTEEEERRLCYVGITRAQECLCLSYAGMRRPRHDPHAGEMICLPSRFIQEIPEKLLKKIKPLRHYSPESNYSMRHKQATKKASLQSSAQSIDGYSIGGRVSHPSFGEGMIIDLARNGKQVIADVNFERAGFKRLVVEYANLSLLR